MPQPEVWIDMNLPTSMSRWMHERTGHDCAHFHELGLGTSTDQHAFERAREPGAVVLTKDADFADLVRAQGAPPQVVRIRFGNTTNRRLHQLLAPLLPTLFRSIENGEELIEVTESE